MLRIRRCNQSRPTEFVWLALGAACFLAGLPSAASAQSAHKVKSQPKHHVAHAPVAPPELEPVAPPQPVPIPRFTAYDVPTQRPVVTFSADRLTIDSENTTLSDALAAISQTTKLQIDGLPSSSERFPAHLSGTPRQVISELLNGSGFGYVLVASNDEPTQIQKLIVTKVEPLSPGEPGKAIAANSMRPQASRAARYVPPEAIAERRGETVLDMSSRPSAADEPSNSEASLPMMPAPVDLSATPANDPAPPLDSVQTNSAQPASAQGNASEDRKQVSPAGQYMQELYKMRLQQQQQLQGTTLPNPPQ